MPVVYDITRLVSRLFNETPNGIDRVDFALAQHFLNAEQTNAGCLLSLPGPRLLSGAASNAAIKGINRHWGESNDPNEDTAYHEVIERLHGVASPSCPPVVGRKRSGRAQQAWGWVRNYGVPLGASLRRHVPQGACYMNISQFPLWFPPYFQWLKHRPDVKSVFFVHDLLPIERPEFFRPAERARHQKRLINVAAFGAGALVSSETVREKLGAYLADLGRPNMPILAAPLPVAPPFYARQALDPKLAGLTYFVCCGTIEPRKNHLMLLQIWIELIARLGAKAPKLVLVGNRGWENENAIDLLERSIRLREHVIEVGGLSTPALKNLLDGAQALLMPSFAEGYGLPIAEALIAGVPVIASDIPVFHEIGGERITKISPLAGEQWLAEIMARTKTRRGPTPAASQLSTAFFTDIEAFLAEL